MNYIVIGGSDAGISAALRAKEIAPETAVTVLVRDRYPNFSICGIPFYLGGEVSDWRTLAHRTVEDIRGAGIDLLLEHTAGHINPDVKTVTVSNRAGDIATLSYDRLAICTGAVPSIPAIEGVDSEGVFPVRWMDDCLALSSFLATHTPERVAIIGGGYIGVELADAFMRRGCAVTLVEYRDTMLPSFDPGVGAMLGNAMIQRGVIVRTGTEVERIGRRDGHMKLEGSGGWACDADCVLVVTGVRPETALGESAGIRCGAGGALSINHRMETNVKHIYAAGDCAQTWHYLLEDYLYLPLGTVAHKQGRIAGENAVGDVCDFKGTLGTQSVQTFGRVAAKTGLTDGEARRAGYDPLTVSGMYWDHKAYYPGAHQMMILLTGDRTTRKLLGMQILGHTGAEVSKRVDIVAAALHHEMLVTDMDDLDLSYTPPLSSPWDPVQMAAQAWFARYAGLP